LGNAFCGLEVSAPNNTVGGSVTGARNIISGNNNHGVLVSGLGGGNKVEGNFIGTDVSGTIDLGNSLEGVSISNSPNNTVGGTVTGARNIISGNNNHGVMITGTSGGNKIQGNFIGTDLSGTIDLGNSVEGLLISNSPNHTVGGTVAGSRNVISGNNNSGVEIFGPSSSGNLVQGNFIGINVNGTGALRNNIEGININDAPNNTIGGTVVGAGNVISGNSRGVLIEKSGASGNLVQGNFIGTNSNGTGDLGNSDNGVRIEDASNNIIGGTVAGARNIISGNDNVGLVINRSPTTGAVANGNQVQGNFIGTNVSGTAALPNFDRGIHIQEATNSIVGGTVAGARNIISGNQGIGLVITGIFETISTNSLVQGNFIGTNAAGTAALGNSQGGVIIVTSNNTFGGSQAGAGNIVAFNGDFGLYIDGGTGNAVRTNSIFSNSALGLELPGTGVTPNDNLDSDSGPNNLQNYPVITAAVNNPSANTLMIQGTLNSAANTTFALEFFSNAVADASGYGEGQSFRGTTNVTTNGSGNGAFSVILPSVPPGHFLTATATDPGNNTSEFSQAFQVTAAPSTVQFSSGIYAANEADNFATIAVTRMGDTSAPATVDYAVTSNIAYMACDAITGQAAQNCDYTFASGTLRFAANETNKSFVVIITNDLYAEGNELLTLGLSNPTGSMIGAPGIATLTILDNDAGTPTTNPADVAQFFVRQHYSDFLSRLPDQGGLDFWTAEITSCGLNLSCVHARRVRVSNAFFYEQEFQRTAAYVFRLYRASYGNDQPSPNPDPGNVTEAKKIPSYNAFIRDRARVVDGPDLALQQLALAQSMVLRPEFLARYPNTLTGPQFVDALLATIQNASGASLVSQRDALITLFNQSGRGAVLYRLADDNAQSNPINNRAFVDAEYNRSFIYGEYAGYLRRDSDIGGFLFWLGQINRFPVRDPFIQNTMVCAFITSREYQERFSPVVTRANADCAQ
jgi:hypothetical protein